MPWAASGFGAAWIVARRAFNAATSSVRIRVFSRSSSVSACAFQHGDVTNGVVGKLALFSMQMGGFSKQS